MKNTAVQQRSKLLIALVLGILLTGCGVSSTNLRLDEVNSFIRDRSKGFFQEAEVGNFTVELMYLPPAAQVHAHMESGEVKEPKQLFKDFEGLVNLSLRMKHKSNTPFDDLVNDGSGDKLAYLIGSIAEQLHIEYGDSTANCLFHHFERDYGLSPYGVVNMAFKRPSAETEKFVFVYDDILFDMGPIRFHVPLKKLDESFNLSY